MCLGHVLAECTTCVGELVEPVCPAGARVRGVDDRPRVVSEAEALSRCPPIRLALRLERVDERAVVVKGDDGPGYGDG